MRYSEANLVLSEHRALAARNELPQLDRADVRLGTDSWFCSVRFNPAWQEARRWISERGTELARGLAETQHEAIRALVARAALMGDFGPDELARVTRPLVGATAQEAQAVLRYHESLRAGGMKATDAQKRALEYSQRVHRYRAMRIARTELAWAWNRGALAGAMQARDQGHFSTFDRIWITAKDERVCPVCGPLDEVRVPDGAQFPGGFEAPPAHPQCRCGMAFEVSGPPVRVASSAPVTFEERVKARIAQGLTTDQDAIEIGRLIKDEAKARLAPYEAAIAEMRRLREEAAERWSTTQEASTWRQVLRLIEDIIEADRELQTKRETIYLDLLRSIRPLGFASEGHWWLGAESDVKNAVMTASAFLPRDWLEVSARYPLVGLITPRGYYQWRNTAGMARIALSRRSDCPMEVTALHELGHRMEDIIPRVVKLERAFYARRTAGEPVEYLAALLPFDGYGLGEVTRKDRFVHPYMGRDYTG